MYEYYAGGGGRQLPYYKSLSSKNLQLKSRYVDTDRMCPVFDWQDLPDASASSPPNFADGWWVSFPFTTSFIANEKISFVLPAFYQAVTANWTKTIQGRMMILWISYFLKTAVRLLHSGPLQLLLAAGPIQQRQHRLHFPGRCSWLKNVFQQGRKVLLKGAQIVIVEERKIVQTTEAKNCIWHIGIV